MVGKIRFIWFMLPLLFSLFLTGCGDSYADIAELMEHMEASEAETSEKIGTEETVDSAAVPNYSLGIVTGAVREYEGQEITLQYEGDTIEFPYKVYEEGVESLSVGLLLFLDGYPQPYSIKEQGTDDSYMHLVEATDCEETEFTLVFTPVTGKEGDVLDLTVMAMTNPTFKPDETQSYGSGDADLVSDCVYIITFQADAEPADAELFAYTACNYEEVGQELVTEESLSIYWSSYEYSFCTMEEYEEINSCWTYLYLDGVPLVEYGTQRLDFSGKDTVHVRCETMAPAGARYQTVFYLDNVPVALSDGAVLSHAVDAKKGWMDVIEFDLDVSEIAESATFYAVTAPRNYYEEAGVPAERIEPLVLLYK